MNMKCLLYTDQYTSGLKNQIYKLKKHYIIMNTLKQILLVTSTLVFAVATSSAALVEKYDLPAVGGYDVVSYHEETGPLRGSGFHVAKHEGVVYLFASEENKATFETNPSKYLPAYNGFCAYGVALGKKFHTDPTVYEIVDGTLYLNLDSGIQEKWSEDVSGNIAKADTNWKSLK